MGAITDHSVRHVNALSIGVLSGTGISAAERTNNTERLNYYSALGYSVYFPPGDYEINDAIVWPTSASNVKVWGDLSRIYQITNGRVIFQFDDVNKVEVTGMHMHGTYFTRGDASFAGNTESVVYAQRCRHINVHDNIVEGNSAHGINIIGGSYISVNDNEFVSGTWDQGGPTEAASDIRIGDDNTLRAEYISICRNKCNTNTLLGIQSLRPTKHMHCKDNFVISKDPTTGVELTAYSIGLRKEGIQVQYHTDLGQGGSNTDDSRYEMEITGNKVQGVRFAAISCQANVTDGNNTDGIRGNISKNQARYFGLEQNAAATDTILGGIVCQIYRDVIIEGNILKEGAMPSGNAPSAIHVETYNSPIATGPPQSCLIRGNIITECACRGIRALSPGDLIIEGNLLMEVVAQQVQLYSKGGDPVSTTGRVQVHGNRFVSSGPMDNHQLIMSGPAAEMSISNNHFEFTGVVSGGSYAMHLTTDRFMLTGNRFIGRDSTTGRALLINNTTIGRATEMMISSNVFRNYEYGIFLSGSGIAARGPIIHHNSSFENVNRPTWDTHANDIFAGEWNTHGATATCVVWADDFPTVAEGGTWNVGDVIWHWQAQSGQPMGWICSTGGNPGTWTPMANIP